MTRRSREETLAVDVSQSEAEVEIPNVIFIPEKTLLCRWDSQGSEEDDGCSGLRDEGDLSTCSSLASDEFGVAEPTATPPRAPLRSSSPSRGGARRKRKQSKACRGTCKVHKHREASKQSGVDIGAVSLVPVSFQEKGKCHCNDTPLMACTDAPACNRAPLHSILPSDQVTAVFCIRREGCVSCRDHGNQLTELAKSFPNLNLFGVVKKSCFSSDPSLCDFYQKYFPFPIYKDEQWDTFRFLGNRNISVWKTLKKMPVLGDRMKERNLENQLGGDHFTQGGVLLFDKTGKLRYVYYERFGDRLDMEALKWAVQDCQQEDNPAASSKIVRAGRERAPPQRTTSSSSAPIKKRDKACRLPRRRHTDIPARQPRRINTEVYV